LVVPSTHRASIGDRAFAVAGPRAWNSLPPALCSTSTSFITFKKELQSFLFGLSFCLWQRILFIDYVQRSSSSLCRILRYRNRLNYITLHYTPGVMPASWSTLWRLLWKHGQLLKRQRYYSWSFGWLHGTVVFDRQTFPVLRSSNFPVTFAYVIRKSWLFRRITTFDYCAL